MRVPRERTREATPSDQSHARTAAPDYKPGAYTPTNRCRQAKGSPRKPASPGSQAASRAVVTGTLKVWEVRKSHAKELREKKARMGKK